MRHSLMYRLKLSIDVANSAVSMSKVTLLVTFMVLGEAVG